jgi:glyoxylase-like metal-dependent hydrolase (beta-lactamase superfamily II)
MKFSRWGRPLAGLCAVWLGWVAAQAAEVDPLVPAETPAYPADLLARLRAAAHTVPGPAPREVRYAKVAETHRPQNAVLENGTDAPTVLARTAFQLVYPAGTLMVDAGMDLDVHRFFGMGREEPYWPDRNDAVQRALREASLVVVTHEHGDHVAGVVRSPQRDAIASHTMLTKAQVETLILAPQMPELALTPQDARRYLVVDYELLYPVAPGVVLLKSPGHTPGHQMVYARLDSGREYLFIGDVSWSLAGVTEQRQRPPGQSERIREDRAALAQQLRWLHSLVAAEGLVIVPSHDQDHLAALEARQLLRAELSIP